MYKRTRITAILPYVLVCALSLRFIMPLLRSGFFRAHDSFLQIYHMIEFNACINNHILYPRWFPDIYWGYGGPLLTFYEPFFYYMVLPFYWLTHSYFTSFKIVIGLGVILSGLFMYCFARPHWGRAGALLAAAAYMYAPYHIVDIYVRGAFPESFMYVYLPALMLLVRKVITADSRGWGALFALILGISFVTHPLCFLFPLILIPYAIVLTSRSRGRRAVPLVIGFALALGLSAFYWIPIAIQHPYIYTDQLTAGHFNYRDHFVYPAQLLYPSWGWGDSLPGPDDGMSFQIGVVHVAFLLLAPLAIPNLTAGQRRITILVGVMSLLSIFMMLPPSVILWNHLPFIGILQYPWRLLGLTNFFTSFLAGAALYLVPRERSTLKSAIAATGIIFILVLYGRYCRANYPEPVFQREADCSRETVLRKPVWQYELMFRPRWAKQLPEGVPHQKVIMGRGARLEDLETAPHRLSFRYTAPGATRCTVNTFYYPCWKCSIDGTAHPIQAGEPVGEIIVRLPPGEHNVLLQFTNPPSVKLAWVISLISLFLIILMMFPSDEKG